MFTSSYKKTIKLIDLLLVNLVLVFRLSKACNVYGLSSVKLTIVTSQQPITQLLLPKIAVYSSL